MITHSRLTGYGNSAGNVSRVDMWKEIFGSPHEMFFLPGEYGNIADCSIVDYEKVTIDVATYPFSNENSVAALAEKYAMELFQLLKFLDEKSSEKTQHLIIFEPETGPQEITAEMFTRWYPFYQIKDELFIFEGEESEGGFPNVYWMSKDHQTGANTNILHIFAESSHFTYKPAGKPTQTGKEFLYMLYNSNAVKRFAPERPRLNEVKFPSNGKDRPPAMLNVVELDRLFVDAGVENLATTGKLAAVTEEKDSEVPVVVKPTSNPAEETAKRLSQYEDALIRGALEKETVNLTDMYTVGIEETLNLLGDSNFIIDVFLDMPGLAKKMCIFGGKIHLIPPANETNYDPEDFFGESIDNFVLCTDDDFPTRTNSKKEVHQ